MSFHLHLIGVLHTHNYMYRVFVDKPEDHATVCNTEKDHTRLNHKTADNNIVHK